MKLTNFTLIKNMISERIEQFNLVRKMGTASAISIKTGKYQSKSLDELVLDLLAPGNTVLLKIDVDGLDASVLLSAGKLLAEFTPMVFSECSVDDETQFSDWLRTIDHLNNLNYTHVYIFSNVGKFLNQYTLAEFKKYFLNHKKELLANKSSRYFDCLFIPLKFLELSDRAINSYLAKYESGHLSNI